ncbi:MFS transporter [Saccharopolyspora sp. WRP15-2]|uniref:MFS transporter n=1 Tax=Saccharopolyspora oryzae TaxID=2997343 RepID=A0ABT4UVE1_9PSEU|nr:MFS transporter [Saccharopolyspora oryzae]MDA3625673.1 MFS transporter [Saccharopolyspora oryzae]
MDSKARSRPKSVPAPPTDPGPVGMIRTRVRGRILLLLCAMYFLTYIDRVNISTAAPFIQHDLGLSHTQLGFVLSAFAVPYAFFQAFGGYLADRFGPRVVLGAAGLVWAVSTVLTGFAAGLVSLFAARLALGFGEGASFPSATHAMTKWLPPHRRAYGQGITHAFSRIGNAIAPTVVASIIAVLHWRASFWILGAASGVWVVVWWLMYRNRPGDHPKITEAELAELPPEQRRDERPPVPWRALLKAILPVTFVDFCYGWMLWVYLTWIPSFFAGSYGLELKKFALFTTLVLIAGVVGDTAGGLLSDALLKRTGELRIARKLVLFVGLLGSFICIVPTLLVNDLVLVTSFLALAFFFLELTNPVLWSIPMDIAPHHAGTAGGLMNTGFGLAGVVSPVIFGFLVDQTGSWVVPFAVSAGLLAIGCLAALRLNVNAAVGEPGVVPHQRTGDSKII